MLIKANALVRIPLALNVRIEVWSEYKLSSWLQPADDSNMVSSSTDFDMV